MKEIKLFIRVLFTPGLWIRIKSTNKYWDNMVRVMLENSPTLTNQTTYRITLNGYEIWIANKWFSFGISKDNKIPQELMISRRTALLLSDEINKITKVVVEKEPVWYKKFQEQHIIINTPLSKALNEND